MDIQEAKVLKRLGIRIIVSRSGTPPDKDCPSHSTFGSLGSKKEVVEKTLTFASEHGLSDETIRACQEKLIQLQGSGINEEENEEAQDRDLREGIVYLIKSGRFYKIGKTINSERRVREIALQLPERSASYADIGIRPIMPTSGLCRDLRVGQPRSRRMGARCRPNQRPSKNASN
jgi:hypothetical protein